MGYIGSYLWQLRQTIGSDLVLMPGAMVALRSDDGRILFTQRANDGTWCLPAGAAEPGGSFARTALEELAEEVGVKVAEDDLIPFGCLSRAELHTISYPNGDLTHCFALCFLLERWQGQPRPDGEESTSTLRSSRGAAPAAPCAERARPGDARRLPRYWPLSGSMTDSVCGRTTTRAGDLRLRRSTRRQ